MTAVLVSLASATLYGAADFLGGLAARRATTIAIVVISQLAGLIALGLMLPALPAATPTSIDWIWGAAAGVTGGIGVALLYRALAIGTMAIVAPITAVCAVAVPVGAAIALGERPGTWAMAGIALAITAIVLVSRQKEADRSHADASPNRTRAPAIALASGVAIGLFFLTLAQAGPNAGLWPLVAARGISSMLFAALAVAMRRSIRMPAPVLALAVAGGVLDMFANVLFLIATRHGDLSLVATLSSLYPASTVLLARTVLKERLSGGQIVGIVCALAAVVLLVGAR